MKAIEAQIKHAESKRDFYLNAMTKGDKSMEDFYFEQVNNWNLHIADLKNEAILQLVK